ncbi:MAG: methyltransferase [Gammaproteobacteria bacterium]|nr:methyltransferase [Gammaproteobacteria bacterium]MDH4254825.1 methyltransferase [Gammaproteobacteria bacterium]
MRTIITGAVALLLVACGGADTPPAEEPAPGQAPEAATAAEEAAGAAGLGEILAAQPADVQARYRYRHPAETLAFFGIEPGMTVVEALPGGGWYTKILLPWLGADGKVIGADYALDMWPLFDFMTGERLTAKEHWVADWTAEADSWRGPADAGVAAFMFGALPESMHGAADAVLFIRALHNLASFEGEHGFLSEALTDTYNVLKPGGIVGVVQHHARDDMPDAWADGSNGYLKTGYVIDAFQKAGFEYVGSTDINANEKDRPTETQGVWRLPPGLQTSRDDPKLRAEMEAIGESNRMTLKFVKPRG